MPHGALTGCWMHHFYDARAPYALVDLSKKKSVACNVVSTGTGTASVDVRLSTSTLDSLFEWGSLLVCEPFIACLAFQVVCIYYALLCTTGPPAKELPTRHKEVQAIASGAHSQMGVFG